jgi:hypothetical protein
VKDQGVKLPIEWTLKCHLGNMEIPLNEQTEQDGDTRLCSVEISALPQKSET